MDACSLRQDQQRGRARWWRSRLRSETGESEQGHYILRHTAVGGLSILRHRRDRPKLADRSLDLEIHRRCFPTVLLDLILDVLPFIERAQSRALDRGDVNEHVPPPACG